MDEPTWRNWTDARERYEERAAILEHDGGMPRQDAEREALAPRRRSVREAAS
jgi:hypothetical protein